MVESKRLRFDFTHHKPLEIREIDIVEARVNEMVRQNLPVETEETDLKKAQKDGAKAFFQDKYGEKVRVVNIGSLSKELCGGTHVETSGAIGFFKIFSQSSVAAGIRRIEAVTGARAVETNQEMERKIAEIAELLNVGKEGLTDRIKQLNKKIKGLEKGEKQKRTLDLVEKCDELIKTSVEVEGGKLILGKLQDALPEEMRQLGDRIKDKLKDGVIVLASAHEGKGYIIIMVTGKLPQKYPAGKLMKVATGAMDGKGGGRPESAQGGGDPAKIEDAFEALKRELQGREK